MDPTASDSIVGCLLDDRYRVGREIARGGMATVYQAEDTRLQRTVAIKIMHAGFAEDAEFVRRFHREAHSAASLSHPNVVAVFDQGHDVDSGAVYLTMEYVPGSTLRDLLAERGALDPETALGVLDPVLDALAAAHRAGLIHRDVKPENILLGSHGQIKVADFGLARAITTSTATQGKLIGTVSYLAPEQLVGDRTDARSDVYAAGVVLYEMLTGYKPHRGETPIQVAYKHVNEDVAAPSARLPGLPEFMDGLVLRSTARDPHVRPADAGVLMHYVRRARTALGQGVDDAELAQDLLAFRPGVPSAEPTGLDVTDPELASRIPSRTPSSPSAPGSSSPSSSTPPRSSGSERTGDEVRREPPRPGRERSGSSGRERTAIAPAVPLGTGAGARSSTSTPKARKVAAAGGGSGKRPGPPGRNQGSNPRQGSTGRRGSGGRQGTGQPGARRPGGPARGRSGTGRDIRPRLSRRVLRRRRLLAFLLAVLLVGGLGLGYWLGFARYTRVPDLRELAGADLRQSARSADVRLDVAEKRVWHDEIEAGQVAKVSPAPGERLLRGERVEVVLSKGTERHSLPKLAGLKVDRARAEVRQRNLKLVPPKRVYRDEVPSGTVVAVDPKPGTVLVKGSSVRLVVSRGPAPVELPDVTGEPLRSATATLKELGLTVDESSAFSDDVPEGRVVSQRPEPGRARRGDAVELVVSRGPEFRKLPDVSNTGVEDAERELRELGFEVRVKKTDLHVGANLVVGQSPAAGEQVRQGETITLETV